MNRPELEAMILGGVLLHNGLIDEVAAIVDADDFASEQNRDIWRAVMRLAQAGKPADFVTVSSDLQRAGMDDAVPVVGGMVNEAGAAANVTTYADMLREQAARDRVRKLFLSLASEAGDRSAAESVGAAMAALGEVRTQRGGASSFADCIGAAMTFAADSRRRREAGGTAGVSYGLPELDRRTGGAQGGELIGVAARTSIGKTAMLNQMAVLAARHGHPGLIVTLEEDDASLAMRAIAANAKKNITKIRLGHSPDAQEAFDQATDSGLLTIPLWVSHDDRLPAVVSRITEYRRRHHIEFAIVDHIGLVRVDGIRERHLQVGEVTRQLKLLAMRLNIPLICAVQLNREAERERPALNHLRESGNIEQDLNTAIFLHAPNIPPTGNIPCEVGILKNRYGKRGWIDKKFEFDGATQRFMQITDPFEMAA